MNTWPNDGRVYCVTKVNATVAGTYKMTIAYAGGEANHPCNIDVRVNGGDWKSVLAEAVTAWNVTTTIETTIELQEGVNTIDVTGACNIWYSGMGWEWVNLDYFQLEKIDDEETTTQAPYAPTAAVGTVEVEEVFTHVSIKKINRSKNNKKATVTLKKFSGAKGYEVAYSLKNNMKKAKTITVKKIQFTIKKLKEKKYYVRVRAFKKVNGKKYFGKWSKKKQIKVKK